MHEETVFAPFPNTFKVRMILFVRSSVEMLTSPGEGNGWSKQE